MRVGRSSAALGRGLFRRVPSWFFLPVGRADGARDCMRAGFDQLCFGKKQSLSSQCSRSLGRETIVTTRILSLHRTDACETDRDSPLHAIAAETAAHTRRKNSARDEGRATQRSNG